MLRNLGIIESNELKIYDRVGNLTISIDDLSNLTLYNGKIEVKYDGKPTYRIDTNDKNTFEESKDIPMCEREIEKDDVTNIETGANILMTDVLTNPTLKNIYLLNKSLDLLEIMRPKIKCGRNTNILALKKVLSACMQNFAENPNEENTDLIFKLKNLIKRFEA